MVNGVGRIYYKMKIISADNFIFTEGSHQIGLGHLMRCIALYDEMEKRNLKPMLIIHGDESIEGIIGNRNYVIDNWYINWPAYVKNTNLGKPCCIIDSYLAEESTYHEIQKFCNKALFIDDTNRLSYPKGIIVNPSLYGDRIQYSTKEGQVYLAGIRYIILRKEFQDMFLRKVNDRPHDVLVIIGGSDICNLTPRIINILNRPQYNHLEKNIVIGNSHNNISEIERNASQCKKTKLYYNLDAGDLAQLMKNCDYALTAAGQTVYELIAMQLPFSCFKIIDNQDINIRGLFKYNIIDDYFDCCINNDKAVDKFIESSLLKFDSRLVREVQINEMKKTNIGKGVRHIIDALVN